MLQNKTTIRGILRWAQKMLISLLVYGVILFLSAGTLRWAAGWAYYGLNFLIQALSAVVLIPRRPEMIADRSEIRAGTKDWDRYLMPGVSVLGPLAIMITAGLDNRFGWSSAVPTALWIASIGVGFVCGMFVTWAMAHNSFFASTVRIQSERNQQVVRSGPYALVRHPGYLGSVLFDLAAPLILNSWWSFLPAGLTIVLIFIRTALEDRTLREELPGYADYAAVVRYRLIPCIW
jgi:protein-S-isoprenylcysteine O-methyltransferase Ste14